MFYGLWKFSLLNYQSILWPSTIPRKKRTEEKGGGGSLICQGIRMKAWPPELLGNGRASQSKRVTALSRRAGGFEIGSQEATAVVICVAQAHQARNNAPSAAPWSSERVLRAPAPTTGSFSAGWWSQRAGKQAGWLQITTVSVCRAQTKETEQPSFFISPTELLGTEEEKAIYSPFFFLK